MPPAPLGARLCRMPAPCLTSRNGVFCRAPGRRRALRLPHIPPKNATFSSEAGRRAEHVRGPKASVPPRADLTPSRHGKRRHPPRFPIGEYTGVHSVPTFSRRPFPAPSGLRAPPGLRFPRASRFRNSFPRPSPSLPSLSFALRRALPRSSPRRSTRFAPLCFALLQQPPNLRPRDSFPVFTPRVALFLFLLAPSFTRPAKQTASRLSDSAFGSQPPAGRRLPASPPDLSLQKSLLFHASPPLFEHN